MADVGEPLPLYNERIVAIVALMEVAAVEAGASGSGVLEKSGTPASIEEESSGVLGS